MKIFAFLWVRIQGRDIRRAFWTMLSMLPTIDLFALSWSISSSTISSELLISEATLGRHISDLNKILTEFQFSIHNGRLKGPEHKIRYFYFWLAT